MADQPSPTRPSSMREQNRLEVARLISAEAASRHLSDAAAAAEISALGGDSWLSSLQKTGFTHHRTTGGISPEWWGTYAIWLDVDPNEFSDWMTGSRPVPGGKVAAGQLAAVTKGGDIDAAAYRLRRAVDLIEEIGDELSHVDKIDGDVLGLTSRVAALEKATRGLPAKLEQLSQVVAGLAQTVQDLVDRLDRSTVDVT